MLLEFFLRTMEENYTLINIVLVLKIHWRNELRHYSLSEGP